jgi:ubiquinone/menaquinone biosynthesis C-methylase UbiE
MTTQPPWFYNEIQQTGLDFEESAQVEAYDRNQGSSATGNLELADRLGIGREHRVIDLGSGTGAFALAAARRGARVHAVDVSRAMLAHARGKAKGVGLGNISFHHGGFLSYAHRDDAADFIVTKYALHHLPDFWKMAALLRLSAMLKARGLLYLEDVVFSFEPARYPSEIEAWIGRVAKPPGEGFAAADFQAHVREEYSTYGWILEGMLRCAGFNIEAAEKSDSAYAAYTCSKTG